MNEEQDTTEIEHQGALPLELPEYHGRAPVGMRTTLGGAGNRMTHEHGIGDRCVIVIEAKCSEAGHRDTDDGLLYIEKMKVVDLFELDRDAGTRMLKFLRSTYRSDRDAASGEGPIEGLGDAGYTDESGVVLLPAEVAERKNDPVRMLTDEAETPAVVMFDDHSRLLWPDEFDKDFPRPTPGDEIQQGRVVELIHHLTGESISWIKEEEDGFDVLIESYGETETPVDRAELEEIAETAVLSAEIQECDATRNLDDDPDLEPVEDEFGETEDLSLLDEAEVDEHPEDDDVEEFTIAAPFETDDSFDDPEDDWNNPDDNVRTLPTPGERRAEALQAKPIDVAFVDCTLPQLRTKLLEADDPDALRRYIEAEKQGRGRGSDPRRGALDAIYARLTQLEPAPAS